MFFLSSEENCGGDTGKTQIIVKALASRTNKQKKTKQKCQAVVNEENL